MRSIFLAFYQLTRVPLPRVEFDEISCARSTAYFPVVGLFLGALMAGLGWAAGLIFPVQVQASLLVAGMIILTGGIHLDGFMDSADGLFSGRPRDRKLEIMRDSRVGAFGVIGVITLLLLKYTAFVGLPYQNLIKLLVLIPALSRWGMSLAIILFPYARKDGLGKIYAEHAGIRELVISTFFAAAAAGIFMGPLGIVLMLFGGAAAFLTGKVICRELGGLTGDTYGFINELLEVLLLLAAYPLLTYTTGL